MNAPSRCIPSRSSKVTEGVIQESRNGLGGVAPALVLLGEGDPDLGLPPVLCGLQTAVPDKPPCLFQLHGELEPLAGRTRLRRSHLPDEVTRLPFAARLPVLVTGHLGVVAVAQERL